MTRRQLPAFGKQLLLDRRAGKHPLTVTVIYGDRWWWGGLPRIAIRPADYAVGKYDFRVVAGVKVRLIDDHGGIADFDDTLVPPRYGPLYSLIGEISDYAAVVEVHWPKSTEQREAAALAMDCKWRDPVTRKLAWPHWWSDERELQFQTRFWHWVSDMTGQPVAVHGAG